MADPFYTCCEDGMLSQVPPTDRGGLCPACKAAANRVRVSLNRVVDNFVIAHLSQYEDAASTGNEGGWTGCGECDCAFTCYHGSARCIRLPADGVQGLPIPRPTGEWLAAELWKGDDYGPTHEAALAEFACAVWERAHGVMASDGSQPE